MRRVVSLYESSVGKKLVMAVTGLLLFGFVLVHMLGNLKVFQGAEKFNAYAEFLREVGYPLVPHGGLLWVARLVLLAAVGAHLVAVVQLTGQSHRARGPERYKKGNDLAFSYASHTMRWGGAIILAFVIYHLLHLTVGTVHPDFDRASPYHNVVQAFSVWWVALAYVVAVAMLGLHLYHGLWSSTQTLAIRYPVVVRWRRPVAAGVAAGIVGGYWLVPLAVLAGIVS